MPRSTFSPADVCAFGFGMGWSPDEYEAAGSPWQYRSARADEALAALKAIWRADPTEFSGTHFEIPRSFIGPKPVQRPHPPIYMAAYVPSALRRLAREADGWFPVGIPLAALGEMFQGLKNMARDEGRNPEELELLVRANVSVSKRPLGDGRGEFSGTFEQIAEDVEAVRRVGASELLFDVQFSPDVDSIDVMLSHMERLRRLV